MNLRQYIATDKPGCLALFDSNLPTYFAPNERAEFAEFLDEVPAPYFVVEDGARIVGCGGFRRIPNTPAVVLTWGMVARDYHHRGVGRDLLHARLARICEQPAVTLVKLQTSQHVAAFFQKAGFVTEEIVPDGYGAGLDQYTMLLQLTPAARQAISAQAAKSQLTAQ